MLVVNGKVVPRFSGSAGVNQQIRCSLELTSHVGDWSLLNKVAGQKGWDGLITCEESTI